MKIITCAGYYATGSSAVTDFFSEFSNCASVGDMEFRFIHDPDGLRDLEYNLIENNNRHNTSNAIKRYIKLAKYWNGNCIMKLYRKQMGNTFLKHTREFVDQITELKCNVWWHVDEMERGRVFDFIDKGFSKVYSRFYKAVINHNGRLRYSFLELLKEKAYFSAIDKETFYKYVREYVEKVVRELNPENKEFVMVDQLLPPSNIYQYLNYFDDIKVIVIDRDPRDLFLNANEFYREKIIPYSDVEQYCKWYELVRRHRKTEVYDPKQVLFVQFEDMIYQYEKTMEQLVEFSGIRMDNWTSPKSHFDPSISIKNTNLSAKFPKYKDDIAYIEQHLKEYLYDFPM